MKLSKNGMIRGSLSVLVYHIVTWLAFGILYYPGFAGIALFLSFLLGVLVIPIYFVQRGNADSGFGVTFLAIHVILCLIEFVMIGTFPDSVWDVLIAWSGWGETLGYTFTFFIILLAGLISPALDGLIFLVRKWAKGRAF